MNIGKKSKEYYNILVMITIFHFNTLVFLSAAKILAVALSFARVGLNLRLRDSDGKLIPW